MLSCGSAWKPFRSRIWWSLWVSIKTAISQIACEDAINGNPQFVSRLEIRRGRVVDEFRSAPAILLSPCRSQRINLLSAGRGNLQSRFRNRKAVPEVLRWCVQRENRNYNCCEYRSHSLRCNMELQQFVLTFPSLRLCSTPQHRLYSLLDYDRVIIMENGKIIEDGNPQELKSNPKSLFTSMLNASDLSGERDKWKENDEEWHSMPALLRLLSFVCEWKWTSQRVEHTHFTSQQHII